MVRDLNLLSRLARLLPLGARRYLAKFFGSRKWLLAATATGILLWSRQWTEAVTVVVTYLGVQGGSDALSSWAEVRRDGGQVPEMPGGD